ncbi:MAG: AAA family ATPase [Candidatus Woesearchaeota archaeon]
MEYKIDAPALENSITRCQVKYDLLYKSLSSRINGKSAELGDIALNSGKLFTGSMHCVYEKMRDFSAGLSNSSEILNVYSAHIASRIMVQDSEDSGMDRKVRTLVKESFLKEKNLVDKSKTEYTTIRVALENMVDYLLESPMSPKDSIQDYFKEYSNQSLGILQQISGSRLFDRLKDIKWNIGPYQVSGLDQFVTSNEKVKSADKQDKGTFHTPLEYLHIPKEKVLPRDRIVGDPQIITDLERAAKCLMLYNPEVGKNPMKERKMFRNKIILSGMPGEGKTAVAFYIIDYAEKLSKALDSNLLVTNFDIDSSYKAGGIQKLKSQLHQIESSRRPIFIFEDEIDGLLKAESPKMQDKDDNQIIQEFNKFLDGQYQDVGNYILLSTLNNIHNLNPANRSKFHVIPWVGARTSDDKSTLFQFKLEEGIKAGYVKISDNDIKRFGNLAFENSLSGRDITRICEQLCSDSFLWENLSEIYKHRSNYATQVSLIDQMHSEIKSETIENEILRFVEHRSQSDLDSDRFMDLQEGV